MNDGSFKRSRFHTSIWCFEYIRVSRRLVVALHVLIENAYRELINMPS